MSYVKGLKPYKMMMYNGVIDKLKDFYIDVHQQVSIDTPVDTGRAQSSWDLVRPGGSAPIIEGRGVRQPSNLDWLAKGNLDVELVNPNKYVIYLNEGWSMQAPAKFIERAISRAVRNAV